jgi:hypothetical protein
MLPPDPIAPSVSLRWAWWADGASYAHQAARTEARRQSGASTADHSDGMTQCS